MKKVFALFLLGLTVSFSAYAAPARNRQIASTAFNQTVPDDGCGSIDPYRACYANSNNYLQCTAKGSLNQTCQMTVLDPVTKAKLCASVTMAGGCQCDPATKLTTGSCQYYR
ncbi:MAG TPA: hypothetical protein VF911_10440 [Thermoanaerobaculia bacterium]